ncbi:hypothetical protein RIF25_03905 [Thermosynechococcaceae cyanobacterium BACA0444]|uniref:Uncharacterized protein n=1 Tax=Pseudocalidococcus azoricus BACA0444 TaxID=2918990 RepID=A0AAE4JYP4_9CYAN|nr:hypothetical protein [Pseudocalidococcus azoricus]MDS3859947.1 hypothetical protein [Pseudocalidococcus azoricus BACA0444]
MESSLPQEISTRSGDQLNISPRRNDRLNPFPTPQMGINHLLKWVVSTSGLGLMNMLATVKGHQGCRLDTSLCHQAPELIP